jgi:hypothetical protein
MEFSVKIIKNTVLRVANTTERKYGRTQQVPPKKLVIKIIESSN